MASSAAEDEGRKVKTFTSPSEIGDRVRDRDGGGHSASIGEED